MYHRKKPNKKDANTTSPVERIELNVGIKLLVESHIRDVGTTLNLILFFTYHNFIRLLYFIVRSQHAAINS